MTGSSERCFALLGIAMMLACGSSDRGVGDSVLLTEVSAVVRSGGPLPTRVEYTIVCVREDDRAGTEPLRFDGELEPAAARAAKIGMLDTATGTWTGLAELPPGSCSVQLRGRDAGGEVLCSADVPFSVEAVSANQVVVSLVCPYGRVTVPELRFNYCPDLLGLRCDDVDPLTASTTCEVRFHDRDNTCDRSCDPQSCVTAPNGLTCTPGPDPGVSTTVRCPDAILDCTGDGAPDESCSFDARTSDASPDGMAELVASFFVACAPRSPDEAESALTTCAAVATDGDMDCDRTRLVTIDCSLAEPDPD